MKKKIIGIFICTILVSTVLPATSLMNETSENDDGNAVEDEIKVMKLF